MTSESDETNNDDRRQPHHLRAHVASKGKIEAGCKGKEDQNMGEQESEQGMRGGPSIDEHVAGGIIITNTFLFPGGGIMKAEQPEGEGTSQTEYVAGGIIITNTLLFPGGGIMKGEQPGADCTRKDEYVAGGSIITITLRFPGAVSLSTLQA